MTFIKCTSHHTTPELKNLLTPRSTLSFYNYATPVTPQYFVPWAPLNFPVPQSLVPLRVMCILFLPPRTPFYTFSVQTTSKLTLFQSISLAIYLKS